MKFYEFLDKQPAVGRLVVVEGTERVLAEMALEVLLDRLLPSEVRDLNLARFAPEDLGEMALLREAVQAMPFLAERRVVVVSETQTMRADPRRALFAVAQEVPEGNTLILLDLLSPRAKIPQPFGAMAGRSALRIDTTADEATRARFVTETLERLGATAEPRAVGELARSQSELAAVRNDLEKLALAGKKITVRDLAREALAIEDPKPYEYATDLAEGRTAKALATAHEFLADNTRGAVALLSALAGECSYIWEMTQRNGRLPDRVAWRARFIRPLAQRVGERRARLAYERAVRGLEAVITGRAGSDPEDHRTIVDRVSIELSRLLHR